MATLKLPVSILAVLAVGGGAAAFKQQRTIAQLRDGIAEYHLTDAALDAARQTNQRLIQGAQSAQSLQAARAAAESDLSRLQAEADMQAAKTRRARLTPQSKAALKGDTFDVSELDQVPTVKGQVRPQYPFEMRRAGSSGQVVVDFVVDAQGNVQNPSVASSSRPEFEAAAIQAVSQWNFAAGRRQGQTVNTRMQVPIVFSLNSDDASWF